MTSEPRTVLVTGANSGIGLAAVLALAHRGFHAVGSVRSEDKAAALRAAAEEIGVDVATIDLDVTDAARCAEVIDELRPYALVNNAGITSIGAIEDVEDEEARAILEIMTIAPMRLARLAIPHMRAAGGGRIVNVSSIFGRITTPLSGWYQAAKHALGATSDALRVEVASDGIKVVLVEPGSVKTAIWDKGDEQVQGREGSRYDRAYRRTIQGVRLSERLMADPRQTAEVIAGAITRARPAARYLVGPDAKLAATAQRWLPDAVWDRVTRTFLGL